MDAYRYDEHMRLREVSSHAAACAKAAFLRWDHGKDLQRGHEYRTALGDLQMAWRAEVAYMKGRPSGG